MMLTLDGKGVCEKVDDLFKKQYSMLGLWHTLADQFYPERADFKNVHNTGSLDADSLVDSFPALARRDLGNSFHAMLRDGKWFELTAGGDYECDRDGKLWLEWATKKQFRIMQTRVSNFERSVKNGDMDFATFGQCVISIEPNRTYNGVLYRNWHLRDCAWEEDEGGQVETVARKWEPSLHELVRIFGKDKLPATLQTQYEKKPYDTTQVYHLVIPSDLTGDEQMSKFKYVSYFVTKKDNTVLEKKGINYKFYVVPRFQTIAGSPYAYSPASFIALPDARTLQAMTYTLLEAAERYARPPIVATQKVVNGPVDLRPNGITWVDNEYDERLGAALRTIDQNKGGYPIGATERGRIYEILNQAFYLDTLNLPLDGGKEMTAYEVQQRMDQYRRRNLPLFAPLEKDYNGQICETTFDLLFMMGALGSPQDIPQSLQGTEVEFKYKSPLTADEEEEKVTQFQKTSALLREAAELDPGVIDNVDLDDALRTAVQGMKAPVSWLRPMDEIQELRTLRVQQQAAMAAAQAEPGGAQ